MRRFVCSETVTRGLLHSPTPHAPAMVSVWYVAVTASRCTLSQGIWLSPPSYPHVVSAHVAWDRVDLDLLANLLQDVRRFRHLSRDGEAEGPQHVYAC